MLKFRRDGSLYPEGDEGLLEWARDFEDMKLRRVALSRTIYGEKLSTVWLGIDHSFPMPGHLPHPLYFETMLFTTAHRHDLQWRYATEAEAHAGHRRAYWLSLIPPLIREWGIFAGIGPRTRQQGYSEADILPARQQPQGDSLQRQETPQEQSKRPGD